MFAALLVGCQPSGPADERLTETRYLRVVDRTGAGLCAGTPLLLDREYERIALAQGLDPRTGVAITVELGTEAVEDRCAESPEDGFVAGCAVSANGEVGVATELAAAPHELVHASRLASAVFGNRFFEEGIAEALRGGEQQAYAIGNDAAANPLPPSLLVQQFSRSPGAYVTAGHFVSWLIEAYGRDPISAALTSAAFETTGNPEEVSAWMNGAFGLTLAEAEQAWRETAAYSYVQLGPCADERVVSLAGSLELAGVLDCGSDETVGPYSADADGVGVGEARSITTCVRIPGPLVLDLELEASAEVRAFLVPIHLEGFALPVIELAGGDRVEVEVAEPLLGVTVRAGADRVEEYVLRVSAR
jgi:hypothetical protein